MGKGEGVEGKRERFGGDVTRKIKEYMVGGEIDGMDWLVLCECRAVHGLTFCVLMLYERWSKGVGSSVLCFLAVGELDTHFQHDGFVHLEHCLLPRSL